MKATPVNDFYNNDVKIREDGRVMHEMYLWQVKPASEAKHRIRFLQAGGDDPARRSLAPAGRWRLSAGQGVASLRTT